MQRILLEKKSNFRFMDAKLQALNPLAIMDKGYSISSVNGEIITDVEKVHAKDVLKTQMKMDIL